MIKHIWTGILAVAVAVALAGCSCPCGSGTAGEKPAGSAETTGK